MYIVVPVKQFKKELRAVNEQGKNLDILEQVIENLRNGKQLDLKYKDHKLIGKYKGCRECHLSPDWLLIYEIDKKQNKLFLYRTGSHSDLLESLSIRELNNELTKLLQE